MSTDEDRHIAAQLFGTVRRPEPTGGFLPSAARLRLARVDEPESAMVVHCDGCGWVHGIAQDAVVAVAEWLGVPVPQPAEGYFLRFDGCPGCGRGPSEVRFVPLSEAGE